MLLYILLPHLRIMHKMKDERERERERGEKQEELHRER